MNAHITAVYKLDLPATETSVLAYLAHLADERHECWPGFGAIAQATGLGRRTVIRAIECLQRAGYLIRVARPRLSNLYRLRIPGVPATPVSEGHHPEREPAPTRRPRGGGVTAPPVPEGYPSVTAPPVPEGHHPEREPAPTKHPQAGGVTAPPVSEVHPPSATGTPPRCHSGTPLVSEGHLPSAAGAPNQKGPTKDQPGTRPRTRKDPPLPPRAPLPESGVVQIADASLALMGSTPGFAAFWQAYPEHRRRKCAECFRFWQGEGLESRTLEIVAALDGWKRSREWHRDQGQYVPGALGFLTDAMWESAPPAPREEPGPNIVTVNDLMRRRGEQPC